MRLTSRPSFASDGVGASLLDYWNRQVVRASQPSPTLLSSVLDLNRADSKHKAQASLPAGDIGCVAHVHPAAQLRVR